MTSRDSDRCRSLMKFIPYNVNAHIRVTGDLHAIIIIGKLKILAMACSLGPIYIIHIVN